MRKPICVFIALGFALGSIVILGFVLHLVAKVSSGHGMDYYFTGSGVRFNYLGALILVALIPIFLCAGWWYRYSEKKEEKDFIRRYLKDNHDNGNA